MSLAERNQRIIEMHVDGRTQQQIADAIGVDKSTVSRVLHDSQMTIVQHRMARKQYDLVVVDPPWSTFPRDFPLENSCMQNSIFQVLK